MIVFTLRVMTSLEIRKDILRNLSSILGPTAVQRGCTACRLYDDILEPGAILLVEEWQTRADLDRHLRSDDFRFILESIERSAGPPEVHFDEVSTRGGLEVIESVRLRDSPVSQP